MEGLKRCPFCGGKAEYHSGIEVIPAIDDNGAYVDVLDVIYHEKTGCPACDVWFYIGDEDPEEITIERWNRRADDGKNKAIPNV